MKTIAMSDEFDNREFTEGESAMTGKEFYEKYFLGRALTIPWDELHRGQREYLEHAAEAWTKFGKIENIPPLRIYDEDEQ